MLTVNSSNGEIINSKDVNIHDYIFDTLLFIRDEKKIHLSLKPENPYVEKRYSVDFIDVIGYEMTCCDFWGRSPYIFDFECVEEQEQTVIPKLFDTKEATDFPYCFLKNKNDYIETVITFTSGDHLRIACESILLLI